MSHTSAMSGFKMLVVIFLVVIAIVSVLAGICVCCCACKYPKAGERRSRGLEGRFKSLITLSQSGLSRLPVTATSLSLDSLFYDYYYQRHSSCNVAVNVE